MSSSNPTSSSVVLVNGKKSGVATSLSLHPLPILNISEHLVRSTLQNNSPDVKVYGALLGTQSGTDIEVHNSFELKVSHGGGVNQAGPSSMPQVDGDFFRKRQAMYKQVFPTFDILGWYSNGPAPTPADIEVHKQLLEYNESPLFLQISPSESSLSASSKAGELPLQLYESHMELPAAQDTATDQPSDQPVKPHLSFVRSSYTIQTGEAERIAVDYTARPSQSGAEGEAGNAIATLTTQQSAIRMLAERIQIAKDYLAAVRIGALPRDHQTLRTIKSVLASMPAMNTQEFRDEFLKEYNDVMLTSYLSSMTRGLQGINELVDKFDVVASSYSESSNEGQKSKDRRGRVR